MKKKNESSDLLVENQRKYLNKLYDEFVAKEGYLNRDANKKKPLEKMWKQTKF